MQIWPDVTKRPFFCEVTVGLVDPSMRTVALVTPDGIMT